MDFLKGDGYDSLRLLALEAVEDAASGKGKERHAAKAEPIEEQQIVKFGMWMNTPAFNIGQASKKAMESLRLPPERAIKEIDGAVNYLLCAKMIIRKLGGAYAYLNPFLPESGLTPEPVEKHPMTPEEQLAEIDRLTDAEIAADGGSPMQALHEAFEQMKEDSDG